MARLPSRTSTTAGLRFVNTKGNAGHMGGLARGACRASGVPQSPSAVPFAPSTQHVGELRNQSHTPCPQIGRGVVLGSSTLHPAPLAPAPSVTPRATEAGWNPWVSPTSARVVQPPSRHRFPVFGGPVAGPAQIRGRCGRTSPTTWPRASWALTGDGRRFMEAMTTRPCQGTECPSVGLQRCNLRTHPEHEITDPAGAPRQPIDCASAVANTATTLERHESRIDSGQGIGHVRQIRRQLGRPVSQ